jgi:hypothetical protein
VRAHNVAEALVRIQQQPERTSLADEDARAPPAQHTMRHLPRIIDTALYLYRFRVTFALLFGDTRQKLAGIVPDNGGRVAQACRTLPVAVQISTATRRRHCRNGFMITTSTCGARPQSPFYWTLHSFGCRFCRWAHAPVYAHTYAGVLPPMPFLLQHRPVPMSAMERLHCANRSDCCTSSSGPKYGGWWAVTVQTINL